MAIDAGGLDYTISVRDQFSSNVDAFRSGITGALKEFRALKTELSAPVRSSGQRELVFRIIQYKDRYDTSGGNDGADIYTGKQDLAGSHSGGDDG